MEGTLIQPCRVDEEGALRRKVLLDGNKMAHAWATEGTVRISTG